MGLPGAPQIVAGGVQLSEIVQEAQALRQDPQVQRNKVVQQLLDKLLEELLSSTYDPPKMTVVLREIDAIPDAQSHEAQALKRLALKQRRYMQEQAQEDNESTSVVEQLIQDSGRDGLIVRLGKDLERALESVQQQHTREAEAELDASIEAIADAQIKPTASNGNVVRALERLQMTALKVSQTQKKRRRTGVVVPTATTTTTTTTTPVPSQQQPLMASIVADFNHLMARAAVPIVSFASAVAVKLRQPDVRKLLVFQPDNPTIEQRLARLVRPDTDSMESFLEQTADLGPSLQTLYLKARMDAINLGSAPAPLKKGQPASPAPFNAQPLRAELIASPCLEIETLDERMQKLTAARGYTAEQLRARIAALDQRRAQLAASAEELDELRRLQEYEVYQKALVSIRLGETEQAFAPAWAFELVGSAVFRKLLAMDLLAAMDMALAEVKAIRGCETFTMKELICSPAVQGQFAFLVASSFLLSGDTTTTAAPVSGASRHYRNTYLNIHAYRTSLAESRLTCKVWFESVGKRANPLLARFDQAIQAGLREKTAQLELLRGDWLTDDQFATIINMLPEEPDALYMQLNTQDPNYVDWRLAFEQMRSAIAAWLTRMRGYKAMMPKYELVQTRF